jgi:GcrA cell cycle regulator
MTDWTKPEDDRLRALWAQDDPRLSTNEIARQMNITKNAVVGRAHRLKLPARPSPLVLGMVWTHAKDDELRALVAQGLARGTIADRLGCGTAKVVNRCCQLGLALLPPGGPRPRSDGVRPLLARGAAVVERARQATVPPAMGGGMPRPADVRPASAPPPFFAPALTKGSQPPGAAARGCRWPLWADAARPDHRYCGAAVAAVSYCAAHADQAFARGIPTGLKLPPALRRIVPGLAA